MGPAACRTKFLGGDRNGRCQKRLRHFPELETWGSSQPRAHFPVEPLAHDGECGHRLVVRACLAEAARDRRRISNLRALPIDVPATTDDFLTVADRDQLERGLRRLSPQQRVLLALRHFEGREPAEIAEILGIPVGTARSRLHHAHRAMRAALDADARVTAIGGRPA